MDRPRQLTPNAPAGDDGRVVEVSNQLPPVPALPEGKLAPPSAEPVVPPGLTKIGDKVRYEPSSMPRPGNNRFWTLEDYGSPSVDGKWEKNPYATDSDEPGIPPYRRGDFSKFADERPRFVAKRQTPPKTIGELQGHDVFWASERIVDAIRDLDPEGISVQPIDIVFGNGEGPKYQYYFMVVTRVINPIDYANSEVDYERMKWSGDQGYSDRPKIRSHRMLPNIPKEFHVFRREIYRRTGHPTSAPYISTALKDRIQSLRPKVKYIKIQDPGFWMTGYNSEGVWTQSPYNLPFEGKKK